MLNEPAGRQDGATDARVVFGDTALARAVAEDWASQGPVLRVTAGPAEGARYPILRATGDAAIDIAAAAADRVPHVFVDADSDRATAAILHPLLAQRQRHGLTSGVTAHIRDSGLRRAITDRLESVGGGPRLSLLGVASVIARTVVARERLFDQAYWRNQDRLHAIIVGFTALGRACFEEVAFAGIAGHLAKPRITLVVPDPARVRDAISQEMPEIDQSVEVVLAACAPGSTGAVFTNLVEDDGVAGALTAVFVCLDDEATTLAATAAIADVQKRFDALAAPAHVLSEAAMPAVHLALPLDRPHDIARRFTMTDGIAAAPDLLGRLTTGSDVTARRLHDTYRRLFGGSGAGRDWDDLAETYRSANRRAAWHLPQKLWTAGLIDLGHGTDTAAVAPQARETVILPCAQSTAEDALLRRLARLEHDRWCADRRIDGWAYAPTRDDRRRLHPDLIPFDDPRFTDAEIAKDVEQIKFLFADVVVAADDGATVPLILGVSSSVAPDTAIDVAAACKLVQQADWRPIIIVSALMDDAQCDAVDALVTACDSRGRSCRLIIPELRRDNRPRRVLSDNARARLDAWLAPPHTLIVPLRGADVDDDDWADPEAPDTDQRTLDAYLAQRANAIVSAKSSGISDLS
jgi:hypothetical protein